MISSPKTLRRNKVKKERPVNTIPLIKRMAVAPHIVWAILFIIAPLLFTAYFAFTDKSGNFTLSNIRGLANDNYIKIFSRSVILALIATVVCLIIAYPISYVISKYKGNKQKVMIMLIMLPMWTNLLIRTYSWMAILEDTGFLNTILGYVGIGPLHMINTEQAVIFGMIYNFLPYMILPIYSVMSKLDKSLTEVAADLGCNNFKIMTKITLPLTKSGIVSGITMVFVPSISTFYISQKLGGGNFDLIGDTIERQFQVANNYNLGASISLVLMIIILISMAVMNHFADSDEGGMVV